MTPLDAREEMEAQAEEAWAAATGRKKARQRYQPGDRLIENMTPAQQQHVRAKRREADDRYIARLKADPTDYAAYLARRREAKRRRREADPDKFIAIQERRKERLRESAEAQAKKRDATRKWEKKRRLQLAGQAERRDLARVARERGMTLSASAMARTDPTYAAIWGALGNVPPEAREDAASEALVFLLTRQASTPEEAAKLGTRRYWKLFSKFGWVSLDEPAFEGGPARHETFIAGGAA